MRRLDCDAGEMGREIENSRPVGDRWHLAHSFISNPMISFYL